MGGINRPPVIEVFADLWCPFAYVGLTAARSTIDALGHHEVALWVRSWPLELINGTPMDPDKAAGNAADLRDSVAPTLFCSVDTEHFPTTTLPGLALIHSAYERNPELGERASFLIRHALFDEGRDISDPQVLGELSGELGLGVVTAHDRAGVASEYAEGQRRGVIGSPHFFCGSNDHFCPSLEISHLEGVRQIQLQAAELTAFLDSCLKRGPRAS